MEETRWLEQWREEERTARIFGWDFSHIEGRYTETDGLPWDYREMVLGRLTPEMRVLDIDTGGGEFLCSLGHPPQKLAATEAYPPNVELCREKLLPMGIDFRPASGKGPLPFEDDSFDMVINRHGDFNPEEIFRILKNGGMFITQQVGGDNDRELVELLMPGEVELPFPEQHAHLIGERFRAAGFSVCRLEECYRPIRFYDVGALVWFARIIEWEFPGFSVDFCREGLLRAQELVEQNGFVEGRIHRILLVAKK